MTITKQETPLPTISIPKLDELNLHFPKEYEVLARQALSLLKVCESLTEQYVEVFRYYSIDSKVALSRRETQLWNTILLNSQTDRAKLGSEDKRKQALIDIKNNDAEYQRLLQLSIEATCLIKQLEQAKTRYEFLLYMTQQSMRASDHSMYVSSEDIREVVIDPLEGF